MLSIVKYLISYRNKADNIAFLSHIRYILRVKTLQAKDRLHLTRLGNAIAFPLYKLSAVKIFFYLDKPLKVD